MIPGGAFDPLRRLVPGGDSPVLAVSSPGLTMAVPAFPTYQRHTIFMTPTHVCVDGTGASVAPLDSSNMSPS